MTFTLIKQMVLPQYLMEEMKIVLANWPHDKHIICNINNGIPIKIPGHPYDPG